MRVRVRRFRGLRVSIEQAGETKRIEVSSGKRGRQGRTVRQMHRAVRGARRACGEVPTDPETTQLRVPLYPVFPLLPDHGSQPTPYPSALALRYHFASIRL